MNGHQIHLTSILSTIFVWGAMLERHKVSTPKPTNKAELKSVLEATREDPPQGAIDPAVLGLRKRPQACTRAGSGHPEHPLKQSGHHQQTAPFKDKNQFKRKCIG